MYSQIPGVDLKDGGNSGIYRIAVICRRTAADELRDDGTKLDGLRMLLKRACNN